MSEYGPPGAGRPDDPFSAPASPAGGFPPPPGGYPPSGGYPPPPSGFPPPESLPPPTSYPPPPAAGGYPPSGGYPPAAGGYPPPPGTDQWSQPPAGVPGGPVPYPPLTPPPPVKKGGKKLLIILLAVGVLVCGCLGVGGLLLADYGKKNLPDLPDGIPTYTPLPTPKSPSASPSGDVGLIDGLDIKKGECVVNEGTDSDADLKEVPCGPGTYEVLSRIPFTTDGDRCQTDKVFGSPEADANYVHDDQNRDYLDYVLCLKKR